jgi:hypothetical protein
VSRARVLLLLIAIVPACSFRSPNAAGDGGLGDDDAPIDAGPSRCDLAATWEEGKQPTKTIYVSKMAGPGTPDGSQTNPYTSLVAANPAITAGTRIMLGPGDFAGATFTNKQGTADAPIWLEGPESGPGARISGALGSTLHLVGPRYWVIRNLAIAGITGQAGLNVDDGSGANKADHVVVDRVTVGSTDRPCLQFSGVTDVTIRDSNLGSCDRGVMLVGVQRATIGRTTIGGMESAGIAMTAGSADIEVRQNQISDIQGGRGVWIGGDSLLNEFRPPLSAANGNTEATNIRVFDNVILNVRDAIECSICTNSLVAHNLLRDVSRDVLNLTQPYTSINSYSFARAGGVRFVNNAIEGTVTGQAVDAGSGTAPTTCRFSYNMWYRPLGTWDLMLPSTEEGGIHDKQSGYSNDGRLCAGSPSPAVGAGTALPEVDGTLAGTCRPSPRSIGPSEPDPGC